MARTTQNRVLACPFWLNGRMHVSRGLNRVRGDFRKGRGGY